MVKNYWNIIKNGKAMTEQQEYLVEKLQLTIETMAYQGKLMEKGKTTTKMGVPRTEHLQKLKKKAHAFLMELEETLK
jgi:hypothetical protein